MEFFKKGCERSSAMTKDEFRGYAKFGHRSVLFGKKEDGIVAEAQCASGSEEDFALDFSAAGGENFTISGGGEDAVIAGSSVFVRSLVKCVEEA